MRDLHYICIKNLGFSFMYKAYNEYSQLAREVSVGSREKRDRYKCPYIDVA